MEDQGPHLDALAGRDVVPGPGVGEGGVGHAAGAAVGLGVEALDEQDLLGREPALVVPAVAVGVPDRERLPLAVRVDEGDGDEVGLGDRVRVGDGERVPEHRPDRPPHVDDLHAALEELGRLLGRQVVRDARERGRVRLVDVHTVHGAPPRPVAVPLVRGLPPDRVVEDEDLGRAGAWGG